MKKLLCILCMLALFCQMAIPVYAATPQGVAYDGNGVMVNEAKHLSGQGDDSLGSFAGAQDSEGGGDPGIPGGDPDDPDDPDDPGAFDNPSDPNNPGDSPVIPDNEPESEDNTTDLGDPVNQEDSEAELMALVIKATNQSNLQTAINDAADSPKGGTVTIGADIVINSQLRVPEGKKVTLKSASGGSYELKRSSSFTGNLLYVDLDGSLVLQNIILDGGYDASDPTPLEVNTALVFNRGTLELKTGSIIRNNYNTYNGGGVMNYATMILSGGIITGNRAIAGGGVYSYPSGGNVATFTMKSGSITNNEAYGSQGGGGVYVNSLSTSSIFKMSGGSITGNTAPRGGGVLVISDSGGKAIFTLTGGNITGNTATGANGGGVINVAGDNGDAQFRQSGGSITGNKAIVGGGVQNYASGTGRATFSLTGGSIAGNTSSWGGGVYNCGSGAGTAIFSMSGGSITGNAGDEGGGVHNRAGDTGKATFSISGSSKISGNTASREGGGVYSQAIDVGSKAELSMSAGSITGNTADLRGGGIYYYKASGGTTSYNLSGGSIKGNIALKNGGDLYTNTTVSLSKKPVVGNSTATGGVWLAYGGELALSATPADALQKNSYVQIEGADESLYNPDKAPIVSGYDANIHKATFAAHGDLLKVLQGNGDPNFEIGKLYLVRSMSGLSTSLQYLIESKTGTPTKPAVINLSGNTPITTPITITDERHITLTGGSLTRDASLLGTMIQIAPGSSLTLTNITIDGAKINTATDVMIDVQDDANGGGTLNIKTGARLVNNINSSTSSTNRGGAVRVEPRGKLNMSDGVISDNQSEQYGGGVYLMGIANITGGYIGRNQTNSLTPSNFGGGIVIDEGNLTMSGGTIANNTTTHASSTDGFGGAIYVMEGGGANIRGGSIIGNEANTGGALYITKETYSNLSGGTISNNIANLKAGAIYITGPDASFAMTGGTVRDNYVTGSVTGTDAGTGGGLYAEGSCFLALEGGAIQGNGAYVHGSDIFTTGTAVKLTLNKKVTIGKADSPGGLYMKNPLLTSKISGKLSSGSLVVIEDVPEGYAGEALVLKDTAITSAEMKMFRLMPAEWALIRHPVDNMRLIAESGTLQKKINEAPEGTKERPTIIKVTTQQTISSTLFIGTGGSKRNIRLTGGGKLVRGPAWNEYLIEVSDGSSLVLEKIELDGGGDRPDVTHSLINNKGDLTIRDGALLHRNNMTSNSGGAVLNDVSGNENVSFTMTGGIITDNKAPHGGGVSNLSSGNGSRVDFTMVGGSITGNKNGVTGNGGGVYNWVSAGDIVINMTGGSITGNEATSRGGGLYNYATNNGSLIRFTMSGGIISGNKSVTTGGVSNRSANYGVIDFTMTGGSIAGNTASYYSGVQNYSDVDGSVNFKMTGGSVANNTATYEGGGVNTEANNGGSAYSEITGGSITGNRASYGGGVYNRAYGTGSSRIVFKMTGGSIAGNSSTINGYGGGGVHNYADGPGKEVVFEMSGGSIVNNTAIDNGGGIYNRSGNDGDTSFMMTGGTINDNAAEKSGGGVYNNTYNGKTGFTMMGGAINGNKAMVNGGGLCNYVNGTGEINFTMAGGTIFNNTGNYGGGIANLSYNGGSATVSIAGGSIIRNTSTNSGGGIYNICLNSGSKADILMTGGSITGNKSGNGSGGGVRSETLDGGASIFNMEGGQIIGNTADYYGGGLHLPSNNSDNTFNFTGGLIKDNKALRRGGGISIVAEGASNTIINMEGGAITGNAAGEYGGGVEIMDGNTGSVLNMQGGSIAGNTANEGTENRGNDVYCAPPLGRVNVSGGVIGTLGAGGMAGGAFTIGVGADRPIAPGSLFVKEGTSGDVAQGTAIRPINNDPASFYDVQYFASSVGHKLQYNAPDPGTLTITGTVETDTVYFKDTLGARIFKVAHTAADNPDMITAPAAPDLDGYEFINWNTKEDGTGDPYPASAPNVPIDAGTLYVVWKPIGFELTYFINYTGSPGTPFATVNLANNPSKYTAGDAMMLNAPGVSDGGKIFKGWKLVEAGKIVDPFVTAIDPSWRGPKELVATWGDIMEAPDALGINPAYTPPTLAPGAQLILPSPVGLSEPKNRVFWSTTGIIVDVDQSGKVTALRPGTATVRVQRAYNALETRTFTINVGYSARTPVFVENRIATPPTVVSSITLELGATPHGYPWQLPNGTVNLAEHLRTIETDNSINQTPLVVTKWASSKTSIATVSSAGLVTPKKAGSTVITATTGGKNYKLTIKVVSAVPETLILNKSDLTINVGDKAFALKPTYGPKNSKPAKAVWSVSNQKTDDRATGSVVAKVDQAGKVTAVAAGTAIVELVSTDEFGGNLTASCNVAVAQKASGLTLSADTYGFDNASMVDGELILRRADLMRYPEARLNPTVLPQSTTDKSVKYSPAYDNTEVEAIAGVVAYYNSTYNRIMAGGMDGTATIKATTSNGKVATLKVQVVTPATKLNVPEIWANFELAPGKTKKLAAPTLTGIEPGGVPLAPTSKALRWSSSDTTVATVDKNGTVKAVGEGEAIISVVPQIVHDMFYMPNLLGEIKVTVKSNITSLKIDQKAFKIQGGDSAVLTAVANNGTTKPDGVVWSALANNAVLTVNPSDGFVSTSPVRKNTVVTVTATAPTGKKASVKITVTPSKPVQVNGLKLKKAAPAMIRTGKSFTPSVSVSPSSAGNKNIQWTASVYEAKDLNGADMGILPELNRVVWFDKATGKMTGRLGSDISEAFVKVRGMAQGGSGLVLYSVRIVHATSKVTLSASKQAMRQGDTVMLTASSDKTSPTNFKWKSSNPKVAKVAADGTVIALKAGTATITATVQDGTKKAATCKVTVTQQVRNVVISGLRKSGDRMAGTPDPDDYGVARVNKGKTRTLTAKLNTGFGAPKNKTVVYEILEAHDAAGTPVPLNSIISLNTKTGKVKGLKAGTALVRVYSPECPANDFRLQVPAVKKNGKIVTAAENCKNIITVQVK